DRIVRRLERRQPSSQMLLIPHVLDLTPGQIAAFLEHEPWLQTLGFEGERFGPHTLQIRAAPADMPEGRVGRVLELLLTDLLGEQTPDRRLRETAGLLAWHSWFPWIRARSFATVTSAPTNPPERSCVVFSCMASTSSTPTRHSPPPTTNGSRFGRFQRSPDEGTCRCSREGRASISAPCSTVGISAARRPT